MKISLLPLTLAFLSGVSARLGGGIPVEENAFVSRKLSAAGTISLAHVAAGEDPWCMNIGGSEESGYNCRSIKGRACRGSANQMFSYNSDKAIYATLLKGGQINRGNYAAGQCGAAVGEGEMGGCLNVYRRKNSEEVWQEGTLVASGTCNNNKIQDFYYTSSGKIKIKVPNSGGDAFCLGMGATVENNARDLILMSCDADAALITWNIDPTPTSGVENDGTRPDLTGSGASNTGGGDPLGVPGDDSMIDTDGDMEDDMGGSNMGGSNMGGDNIVGGDNMGGDVVVGSDGNITMSATVVDVIQLSAAHARLFQTLRRAGLDEALEAAGPFTVFAPSDKAFDALANETISRLLSVNYKGHMVDILAYHVVADQKLMSDDLTVGLMPEMANGETTEITKKNHINDVKIQPKDLMADNGVVHGIDAVLLPSWTEVDVVQGAASLPDMFGIFSRMVAAANLTELLSLEGPLTVFAPTDTAFDKLDSETIATLLSPEGSADLAKLLSSHVHVGIVYSENLSDGKTLEMADGVPATITMMGISDSTLVADGDNSTDPTAVSKAVEEPEETYKINNAKIISPDILVNNGVIHAVNRVIVPACY